MINNNEITYKMKAVIKYLKNNGGYNYELYNRLCPGMGDQIQISLNIQMMFYIWLIY